MTINRTPTPVYLDPGMHSGLEVKGLNEIVQKWSRTDEIVQKWMIFMPVIRIHTPAC